MIYTATHFVVIANLRGSSIIRARRHCAATREELSAPTRCRAERESCSEKTVVFIIIKINKTNLLPALFKADTRYRNRFVDKKALNIMTKTGVAHMFSYRCLSVPSVMIHNARLILNFFLHLCRLRVLVFPPGFTKETIPMFFGCLYYEGTKVFLYVEQTRFQVLYVCLQR